MIVGPGRLSGTIVLATTILILMGCASEKHNKPKEVVLYTSLDQIYSEPIIKEFERESGIKVKTVYDVEAAKTVGLVNRLLAEKNNPQADVFWNSEIVRTLILKKKGILAPYFSPSASDIPAEFKDKEGYWTGFAARARVLIYNTELVGEDEAPKSIFALTHAKWKRQIALANPLFGTTATHCAALFLALGEKEAQEYFTRLKENEVTILPGNSTVRDRVRDGELKIGFTDTDDVNIAILEGKPVKMVYPDQEGMGTLLIPNTVALIAQCPHPEEGKRLIDYLLSPEVESRLAFSPSAQMPLRKGIKVPEGMPAFDTIKTMPVDYQAIAEKIETSSKFLQGLFLK